MSSRITVGIDIGTYHVKAVIAEFSKDKHTPHVLGQGIAESRGLRHGYIINIGEASRSVALAVRQAEKIAGIKVKKAYLSVGGIGISAVSSTSSVILSRADGEVTELDLKRALEAAENDIPSSQSLNRKILHVIPLSYKLDGKTILGRPLGMKGTKLEVRALFVACLTQHLQDLITAVEEAGIEVIDVMAAPLAASLVTLTKVQKIAGCVLANIGAETVSMVVFENNIPISLEMFPIGGTDITNDIALGLKVPLEEAEQIKMGGITTTSFPRKKLEEIIEARLVDIFELIETHLKKIGKSGLLPAGIIITGGTGKIGVVSELAKAALKLPSKVGEVVFGPNVRTEVKDSTWAVAYGLCIFGFTQDEDNSFGLSFARTTKTSIINWVKQFLP